MSKKRVMGCRTTPASSPLCVVFILTIFQKCLFVMVMAQGSAGPTPPRSLYIDCGGNKSINDTKGRLWTKDQYFQGGSVSSFPTDVTKSQSVMLDTTDDVIKTFRVFGMAGTSPHYSIPVLPDSDYLIRLKFPFYNSGEIGHNLDSVFKVALEGILNNMVNVSTIQYNATERGRDLRSGFWDVVVLELATSSFSDRINVTFIGPAKVSSIEVIGLGVLPDGASTDIVLTGPGGPIRSFMKLEHRINCGGPPVDNSLTRPYIWEGDAYFDGTENTTNVSSTAPVKNFLGLPVPVAAVLQSFRTTNGTGNMTYMVPVAPAPKYMINVFWYELEEKFNVTGRKLNIFVDDLDTTRQGSANASIGFYETVRVGTVLFADSRNDNGFIKIVSVPLPSFGNERPIISGLEVYSLFSWAGITNSVDVQTFSEVGSDLELYRYGRVGDPCTDPVTGIIQCGLPQPDIPELRIVLLNVTGLPGNYVFAPKEIANFTYLGTLILSQFGLVGPIPDDWSRLKNLEILDLSNNKLSGTIPDWIADLPSIQIVNLVNNNLTGQFPHSLLRKLGANFTYDKNYGLCDVPGSNFSCPSTPASSALPSEISSNPGLILTRAEASTPGPAAANSTSMAAAASTSGPAASTWGPAGTTSQVPVGTAQFYSNHSGSHEGRQLKRPSLGVGLAAVGIFTVCIANMFS